MRSCRRSERSAAVLPVLLAVMLAAAAAPAAAADPLAPEVADAIREYVASELDALGVPGAAVAVVSEDEVVFAEGFGVAAPDGRPVTAETPFDLASVSKSLTAIAVMQLIEEGEIELEAPVRRYLPWFGDDVPALAEVTVADLLGHTSGWTTRDGTANLTDGYGGTDAIEQNVRRLAATEPSLERGTFEYSNANYDVLGHLVETVSGQSFDAYMRQRVFRPLEMDHSYASLAEARGDGLATGHYPFFGFPMVIEMPFVAGGLPSGFLMASAEDLGHALVAHLNEGRYDGEQVLAPESVATLHRSISRPDPSSGYAMGLWRYPLWSAGELVEADGVSTYEVPIMLEHGGDHPTAATAILLLPEERWGVVVLMNLNDEAVPSRYHQMHYGIAHILLGKPPPETVAYEDVVNQYAKVGFAGVAMLQVLGVAWALRNLRRWRDDPYVQPQGALGALRHVALPLALDLGLAAVAWWLVLDRSGATPDVVLRLAPDIGLALVVISVLGVGWGLLRTALTVQQLRA